MRPKQYHNRAFALVAIALAFFCVTFSLPAQSLTERDFSRGMADSLSLSGMTSISFADRVLLHDLRMSVAALDSASVPPMDYGMTNVTVQGEGCRFLPHGTHFGGEGATVRLRYDRTRIPSGYTEEDIRTYYYDTSLSRWVALERIEVDRATATVVSRTTHFTDMVNGVIVAPETPETGAFVPTMMTDIQAADPTSRLTFIMPPTANNRGSANLQYPFEMPPARNGMQPSLALTYDSDGGSGWAGEGWDIRVPAITVDTRWGVPRYSTEFESETYLLNGQMLAMMSGSQMTVAHRQDSIPRQSERQFFVRQGGDFSKIVRHGDSPNNYWWEVTSRDGTVYTYGSTEPSRVHGNYKGTSDSQPREVIAEWRLTGIRETHGDSIGYVWQAADTPLYGGTITAREVWLSEVTAKNQERTAPHTRVTFHNREQGKAMSTNSARYGFLTTSTRLLGSVDINFRADTIDYGALRTYAMSYEEGVFHRDRLTRIDHIVAGDTVSFQTFDYYDDVRAGNGIAPFESDSTSFSDSAAVMVTAFNQPVPQGHSGHGTLLGGTFSKTYSGSLYAGVGFGATPGKSMTAGASFGYSHTSATGEAAFIDLDGDGLPDKVFKEDGVVKYSRQLITSDSTHFGAAVPLAAGEGVSLADFSRSKTSTVTGGPKTYPGYGPAFGEFGTDFMSSTTKTTHYFADVNGDGLADIVAGGKVLFNHIENGVPTFTLSSGHTPSPINNTGEIDTSSLEVLNDSRDSLVALSPMQDIVRYWDAPLSGTVDITGTVTRLLPPEDYDPDEYALADSLRVSVQKNGQELWWRSIAKGDTSLHASDVASVPVQKGDRILFRLQCGYDPVSNGSFDRVLWPVAVEYTDQEAAPAAPDGMSPLRYTSGDPAVSLTGTMLPVDSSAVAVVYSLHKPATTDDVSFSVRYHASGLPEPLPAGWTVELADSIAAHTLTVSAGNVQSVDSAVLELPAELREGFLSFVISSASNVRWSDIHWSTALRYVQDRDGTADTTDVAAMPQCRAYNRMTRYAPPITAVSPLYADEPDGTMCPFACVPSFSCSSSQTGTVTLTLKSGDTVYARRTYSLQNGGIASSRFWVMLPVRGKVWAEYFTGSAEVAQSVLLARVQLEADTLNPLASSGVVTPLRHPASVHCIDDGGDLGPTYRGWGQLVYNAGGGRSACPIAPSDLSLPQDSDHCDPQTMCVALLTARDGDPTWLVGAKTDIFIHGDTLSTARLADNHVDPLPLFGELATVSGAQEGMDLKGTAARGLTLVSHANSDDGIISFGALGVGISHNDAIGRGVNKNAFIDMNGDGYPDIVTESAIQYTNTLGGFANGGSLDRSAMQLDVSEQGMVSDNGASSNGFGGGPVHSFSINRSGGTGAVSQANASVAASINGTASENWDKMRFNYLDINGDGLPDMLSVHNDSSLHVRLNLGYGFTDEFCLTGVTRLQRTVTGTLSASLSGSFNIDASSFAGGFGVSTSTSRPSHTLMDVNGDGLPDMVWMDGCMKVRLNLGDSFASEELDWNGAWNIGETGATTLSLNTSYTYSPFLFGVKIAISPSLHMAWGMTRPEMELRDIDGDGFIDILESEGESDLCVRRSTIRRTNRLRSVSNSLGGRFEIDYAHATPTYGLPGGKWVMSSVTVDRGIHSAGYDIPDTRQTFDYANGVRDRHEREFLGFGQVRTWQVDPGNDNAPLRQTVEVYDTTSVYTAGSLLLSYVADPQGNRYDETSNSYYTYALTNDCDNSTYNGGRFSFSTANYRKRNDRGAAYSPLCFSERKQYEGGGTAAVLTQDWYQYYDRTGDHGLLRKYRHCVGGGLTESGGGTYDYQTNVEYSYNLSDTAYIIGLPKLVKVTNRQEGLFHLTEASYDLRHFNQITQIKRMLLYNVATPVGGEAGPTGRGDGTGTGTNGIGGEVITPVGRYNPDQEPSVNAEYYPNPVYATTDYNYDSHGNITRVTLPRGADSSRVWYSYQRDPVQQMYTIRTDDIFGLHSHGEDIDYRFGITNQQIDKNGAVSRTTNDQLGRPTSVRSPIDSASAMPAMRFRYHPRATVTNGVITTPAYAVTVYYFPNTVTDNQVPINYTDSMRIVTFVDGFGRPVQVRKDGVCWDGADNVDCTVVSGRADYDGYGRAVHAYHPALAADNTVEAFVPGAQRNEPFTTTAYDLLDRRTAVTMPQPDGSTTAFAYGIDGNTSTTTVTDGNGHASRTDTDGDGRTVQSVQYKGGTGAEALTTTFAYDGIGRLMTVTDTEGNVTRSTYDMGDRRTSVTHPASGETTFTYDALGNVLTRQTANLRDKSQFIRYTYEQGRLKQVSYPGHPENDVIYHYGDGNAEQGLRGRVKFREDGSGGTEYHYDLLGNVNRMKRTVTIPGNTIATAEMTWTYDNFGKLKQMVFPRANDTNEKVTYHYDRAGQLQKVYNGDLAGYHYVKEIGYDAFGDRVHIAYGNGTSSNFSYRVDNRRLNNFSVTLGGNKSFMRTYNYDAVGNITRLRTRGSNAFIPAVSHSYDYDNLNRLVHAEGSAAGDRAIYNLSMEYDDLYRVTSKRQTVQQEGIQFTGKLFAGYNLEYSYHQTAGKRFQMSTVSDTNYRTAIVAPTAGDSIREAHHYEYDLNGNIVYAGTARLKPDMTVQPDTVQRGREERFRWDEENRLTALSQNGYVSHYWYDADGERTVKMHGGNQAVFVNSRQDGRVLDTLQTTAYFSPYFSIHEGRFTKHLYIGSERIASITGELKPGDVSNSQAGGYNISHAGYGVDVTQLNIPYACKCAAMRDSAEANYAHFDLPNALDGQPRQLREFVLPAGGGNEAEAPALRSGDKNNYNGDIWFIHTDHLGSSLLVTDGNGEVSQQVEYLPYGEVFLERQNGDYATPYKFNGKELDEETGLYYYGARYMNPRLSIWYGCDPLQEKYPDVSTYCYTFSNPIRFIDEYGDKPQKSRIEYRGNGIFGININSLSAFSRNDFKRRNNDPRNWTPGEIGINTTVAKLLTITEYTSLTTNSDYSAAGLDPNDAYLKTRAELAKSTGLPDKRVRSHEVFALGSCNSKSIKGSAAFMIMLNVAAVALDYYVLFSANSDYEAIINQKIQLQSAMDAVLKYMEKNDIPSKYRDKHNLGAIINYVFQGENSTGDQRISEFGKLILKANGRYDKNSNQYVPFIQK